MADTPHSIGSSTIQIFGVDLIVHQLSDGRRVIDATSMKELFQTMGGGETLEVGEVDELADFLRGRG